jgi:FkbM family methyltransferase
MIDLIKLWDDELVEMHIGTEINYIKDFFKDKTKLSYIDIGANVGKFYDVLSKTYEIEKVVMVEPAPKLFEYISEKFKHIQNCKMYDFAISDEYGETFFQTHSLDNSTNEHINMGVSKIHENEGHRIKMVSGLDFLKNYVNDIEEYDFIKIDTENYDYQIIKSITNVISQLNKKPFILFEHNYHNSISEEEAKKILNDFIENCGYEQLNFETLNGDCYIKPL